MKHSVVHTILFSIFLISCASQQANAQAGGEPVFTVTTKNQDDQVDLQYEDGTTTVEIHSPTGIGSATLKPESGAMPENIVLQLHITGLEQFRLVSDQTTLTASGSSSEGFNVTGQSVLEAGNEYAITPLDPLWTQVEIVSSKASTKIPLDEGHFEIRVPKEFIQRAGNSFEIQWINFFR